MELKKRIYIWLFIDFLYVIGAATTFILKVHYYYGIILPIYFALLVINYQVLRTQSTGLLKAVQWIRILFLLFYGIIFITGVIMITTYHYGSWENLKVQAEQYYHRPEVRLEVQLLTGLCLLKFLIEVVICTMQNDEIEMLGKIGKFKKI